MVTATNTRSDPPSPDFSRRAWWMIAGLLFLLDLTKHVSLIALGQDQPWPDSEGYWALGAAAANGDWWLSASGQASRTPGYPWFLAGCQFIAGDSALLFAVVVQHAVGMLTAILAGWLTYRILNSRTAGLIAYGILVGLTARDLYANWLLTETLATFLQLATIGFWISALNSRQRWLFPASCGVLGFAILCRPAQLVLVPVAAAMAIVLARRQKTWRPVFLGIGLLAVLLLPWCWRNQQQFDRFTLTVFLGRELWTAHFSPWPGGELEIPNDGAGQEIQQRVARSEKLVDLRHNWGVSGALVASGLNDAETDALMARAALDAIRRQPQRAAIRTGARCLTFWYTKEWPPPDVNPQSKAVAGQITWMNAGLARIAEAWLAFSPERQFPCMWLFSGLTWLSIAFGCLRRGSSRPAFWIIGSVLALTTVMTAALEIPLYRYRLGLEPLMVIAIVSAALELLRKPRATPFFK